MNIPPEKNSLTVYLFPRVAHKKVPEFSASRILKNPVWVTSPVIYVISFYLKTNPIWHRQKSETFREEHVHYKITSADPISFESNHHVCWQFLVSSVIISFLSCHVTHQRISVVCFKPPASRFEFSRKESFSLRGESLF